MTEKVRSIRPFIGAKDFERSKRFYAALGFQESELSHNMSVFEMGGLGFYLQDAYVKAWVDNTMVFLEVEDVDRFWHKLMALELPTQYEGVRLSAIREYDWGREFFLHDPSGILWHIGQFADQAL